MKYIRTWTKQIFSFIIKFGLFGIPEFDQFYPVCNKAALCLYCVSHESWVMRIFHARDSHDFLMSLVWAFQESVESLAWVFCEFCTILLQILQESFARFSRVLCESWRSQNSPLSGTALSQTIFRDYFLF